MTSKIDSLPAFAKTATALSILAAISGQTFAEDTVTENTERKDPLLIVITTATTTPITASESLASVTVIDKDDIEKQQPQEMTELLAGQPGVDITTNGGYGKNTTLYMRGADSDSTLLMVDGIPLYSASNGGAAWGLVSPSNLNKVEILRGPRATLYGAGVAGGVVQAFSQERYGDPKVNAKIGVGSFNTHEHEFSVDGGKNGTSYAVALNYLSTDGTEIKEGDGKKGFNRTGFLAKLRHEFNSGVYLSGVASNTSGHTEYVGDEGDFTLSVVGATLGAPVADFGETKLTVSEARDESNAELAGSHYNTKIQRARLDNILWVGSHEFIVGGELTETSLDGYTGSKLYDVDPQSNTAFFAQGLLDFSPVSLQLNLREDHHERYGSSTTGGVALGYEIDTNHRARLSYGTAFRVPSFNDLYWPGYGNEDLKPGESDTTEFGLNGSYQQAFWDVSVYETNYKNMIDASKDSVSNINTVRIRGVEVSSGVGLDLWTVATKISLMDPQDLETGKRLQRRVEKSARIDVDRQIGQGSLGFSVAGYGDRYDDKANETKIPGYALLNLRASYDFTSDLSASFTVKNALDKDYVTTRNYKGWYYQNPGVGAFLTVNYSAL